MTNEQRTANDNAERADSIQVDAPRGAVKRSGFVLIQVVLACIALAVVMQRLRAIDGRLKPPPLRDAPLTVEPTYDHPWIVSDEQLQQVLYKLRPRLRGPSPKINHVDHALRFWGVQAKFNDPQSLSGEEMRTLLTDHREFAKAWGDSEDPLLRLTDDGVRVRTREGRATASHVDHTVAGLAEAGTEADFVVVTPTRRATMRDLVRYAMREFQLNQTEYEWSTLIFALYLPPARGFVTEEGQAVTFDVLADRIMRQPYQQGVCLGNHRLHALVMLIRIDDQHDILSDASREEVMEHLRDAARRLIAHQHADGYWDRAWSGAASSAASNPAADNLSSQILATGHALEWLALAPQEVHPPRENLVRAGQWLARTIQELDDEKTTEYYTFLTHAGRALSLWRGKFPAQCLPLPQDVPPPTNDNTTTDENTTSDENTDENES